MSIIRSFYKDGEDHVWYESSNVFYSKCIDKENEFKELYVVFKNGACYKYSDVDVNDYIMFKNGGLDGSQGKALNNFIKPKYKYERMLDYDIEELKDRLRIYTQGEMEKEESEKNDVLTKAEELVEMLKDASEKADEEKKPHLIAATELGESLIELISKCYAE